jgi:hypothetical protein
VASTDNSSLPFRLPANSSICSTFQPKLLLAACPCANQEVVLVQIHSDIPLAASLHACPSPLPGADSAVAGSANLPFKFQMPYAGATVTGLTKLLYEVRCLNPTLSL